MIRRRVRAALDNPLEVPRWMCRKVQGSFIALRISRQHNIHVAGSLSVVGRPMIDIRRGSELFIGQGVTLNSRNKGYHINMHSPVKLFADRPGASISIGEGTRIHGTCIHAYDAVHIGRHCLIAANCQIFDGNGHDLSFANVWDRINTGGAAKL